MAYKKSKIISKHKTKIQSTLPFEGNKIINLEFNFNSVSKEEFDKIIETKLSIDIDSPIGRKKKWTIENLVNEIKKYKSLDDFKKEKKHLWIVYKQLVLIEKKNKIQFEQENNNKINASLQDKINSIKTEKNYTITKILEKLEIIISNQNNKNLISDLREIDYELRMMTKISRY